METWIFGALVSSFSALCTVHVALVVGLAQRRPRWHAVVALIVAPLAPYWGFRERLRLRAGVWALSCATYLLSLALAYHR